jgi:hypothetical protein
MDDDYSVNRFRAGLISNIRGTIIILEQNDIRSDLIENIKENIRSFVDNTYFNQEIKIDDKMMLEVQRVAEKLSINRIRIGCTRKTSKIRSNFEEDTKRIWICIKRSAGQATKIDLEIFADHYSQNWEIQPVEITIEENSDFIMQRRLVLTGIRMMKELIDKKKIKDAITKKETYQLQDWTN